MTTNNKSYPSAELIAKIQNDIWEIINEFIPFDLYATVGLNDHQMLEISDIIYLDVFDDFNASKEKGNEKPVEYIREIYKSFETVMYYRISSMFYNYKNINIELRQERALHISETAKVKTGVYIHPAAKIGKRFVIDHGIGTVIGDTCEIGDDCYILQGVILGSRNIKNDIHEKDHPKIGNRVEIASFARIVGNIEIGDDVVINPHCVITQNIPPKTKVVITNQLQLFTPPIQEKIKIYGIIPENKGIITIYGYNFSKPSISLLNEKLEEINEIGYSMVSNDSRIIKIKLFFKNKINDNRIKEYMKIMRMKITVEEDSVIITNSLGLNEAIQTLIFKDGDLL